VIPNCIILCAGEINYNNLPLNTNKNNSMLPVNGKPVISWIINDLIEKGINEFIFVLKSNNLRLKGFLEENYSHLVGIKFVELEHSSNIIDSVKNGLAIVDKSLPTLIILGDTLIKDDLRFDLDYIFTQSVSESNRWSIVKRNADGFLSFIEKSHNDCCGVDNRAVCGYYFFLNTEFLINIANDCLVKNQENMSDIIFNYDNKFKIEFLDAHQWFDFGNLDNFVKAKQKLLQSRFFNTLTIDPLLNTVTKISEYDEKLRSELNWYKSLPTNLQVLTPRIISEEIHQDKLHLTQEYYGYPTVAELYLFSDYDIENWNKIFDKLFEINKVFQSYSGDLFLIDPRDVYIKKLEERINLLNKSDYWSDLFSREFIIYNDQILNGYPVLSDFIKSSISVIVENCKCTIIHGDYCFSNILFDINNQIVRLIDPRGSFGNKGIWGDPRYDIAKLRHSAVGAYDYIVSDLFTIIEVDGQFKGKVFTNSNFNELGKIFDTILVKYGFKIDEIEIIEALLFLSMIPLHSDYPDRQKMMFLTGLINLNKIYENRS
jgi:dTDP-glucose pyrophosphorylase